MINGVIPIYKEAGNTSFFYVNKLKHMLKQKKVGHTGTLDPMVTGVLPICLGSATKLVPFLMEKKKSYSCTVTIGFATETEDLEGRVIAREKITNEISNSDIDQVLSSFEGENYQVPPFFSAVRYHGKHLYKYARNNIYITKSPRLFEINQIYRTSPIMRDEDDNYEFTFEVTCSKGTYIRTLCTQIGNKLGYPAVMKKLVRISSGGFSVKQAVPLSSISELKKGFYSLEDLLDDLPSENLTEDQFFKVKNGAKINLQKSDKKVVLMYHDKVAAVYEKNGETYQALMMFLDNINENT